jgi:hypothetical protein
MQNTCGKKSHETAFYTLKNKLMSKPTLQCPDFSKKFILTTDASNDGTRAVLSKGQIGKNVPIAFASLFQQSWEKL